MPKKAGLALALEEEARLRREAGALSVRNSTNVEKEERAAKGYIEPALAKDRIAIIFDDSVSMREAKIKDAQQGCIEFLRNCQVNQVACAIYPMNRKEIAAETDLPKIAALIPFITVHGVTPLFETWQNVQTSEIKWTRTIIFSDGVPDSTALKDTLIQTAVERKVPCDTVYISEINGSSSALLKEIAEKTGGFYLVFNRNKVNFRDAFKYLSPGLRLQLSDGNFRKALQDGKIK